MSNRRSELLRHLEIDGISTSREIQAALGVSQATVSRLIQRAGDEVLRIGRGPSARYARPHDLFTTLPLYRIDASGLPEHLADIRPLRGGECLVTPHRDERWLLGHEGEGLYAGLPYFLDDLRPQGFIGRAIARSLGAPYPDDPRRWTTNQVLTWLTERGADLPGDLVLGATALDRFALSRDLASQADYSKLADEAMAGATPGSSAGGEQPKFLTTTESSAVLVKFSGRGDGAETSRWRDILIAEHHALRVLREHGIAAATSRLLQEDGRTFLEVQRFDREGSSGRRPMLSLAAIDAEFTGVASDWMRTMQALERRGLVSTEDADRAGWLQLFGHWIGNSDMHLGNLSLQPQAEDFGLLPAYDMAPMIWAPVRGELPTAVSIRVPARAPRLDEAWRTSAEVALEFWSRLQDEGRLSDDLRGVATSSRATVERIIR